MKLISRKASSLDSLLALDFYHAGKNIIMYGSTGTGKTMLSTLIGIAACNAGIPVRFYRTAGLINRNRPIIPRLAKQRKK